MKFFMNARSYSFRILGFEPKFLSNKESRIVPGLRWQGPKVKESNRKIALILERKGIMLLKTHHDGDASLTISNVRFFLNWERHAASIGLCLTISKAVVNLRFHSQKS